jgi:hypothetical protein
MTKAEKQKAAAKRRARRKIVALPPVDPLRRYNTLQAQEYLQLSNGAFYQAVHAGRIRVIKDGRKAYVPGQEIVRLSTLPQPSP